MFRTVNIKIDKSNDLIQTARMFNEACQIAINWGFENKQYNKTRINKATYHIIRDKFPQLPSALVQTARDVASDMLKRSKFKYRPIKKMFGAVRYDSRTAGIFLESGYCKLTTAFGRMRYDFKLADYYDDVKSWQVQNAQLIISDKACYLNVQVKCEAPEKVDGDTRLGIDRGITNIAVCSDNTFYNSKKHRNVKGRYQFLKSMLQSKGTQSAKRHLRKLAGRERRFVKDTNHCISKNIVKKPFDIFCIEDLTNIPRSGKGKKFNKKLGSWSPTELETFITYKSERVGKTIVRVNPRYTSQTCSKCGHRERNNRHGSIFKCKKCGFQLNADLNASRNIATFSRVEYGRVRSITQSSSVVSERQADQFIGRYLTKR